MFYGALWCAKSFMLETCSTECHTQQILSCYVQYSMQGNRHKSTLLVALLPLSDSRSGQRSVKITV